MKNIFDIGETVENTTFDEKANTAVISNAICDTAAAKAAENFSVLKEDFSIKITISETSNTEYSIEKVQIYRKGNAKKISKPKVKEFFEEIFEGAKEVIIDD